MKYRLFYCLAVIFLAAGCTKDSGQQVAIYMLKSFTASTVQTNPAITVISDGVLEDLPLIADRDILFYLPTEATFILKKDIKPVIEHYSSNKAFVVMVNNEPVYFGRFHPGYLSSITLGVATIDPILVDNKALKIQYVPIAGIPGLAALDKRNDTRILDAFRVTHRLR